MTERPPALLPGRSAADFARILARLQWLVVAVGLVIFVTHFTLPRDQAHVIALVSFSLSFGVLAGLGVVGVAFYRAMSREKSAGYTTLAGYDRNHWQLWQLDPETGPVVRVRGEKQPRRTARTN